METPSDTKIIGKYRTLIASISLFLACNLGVYQLNFYFAQEVEANAASISNAGQLRGYSQQLAKALITLRLDLAQDSLTQSSLAEVSEASIAYEEKLDLAWSHAKSSKNKAEQDSLANLEKVWRPLGDAVTPLLDQVDALVQEDVDYATTQAVNRNVRLLHLTDNLTNQLELASSDSARFLKNVQYAAIALALLLFAFIVFGVLRNLKRADIAVKANQQRVLSNVFACSGEAIVIAGPDFFIQSVYGAFTQYTGYFEADVTGRHVLFLLEDANLDTNLRIPHVLRNAGNWSGELVCSRRDGTVFPVWLSISAAHDSLGAISSYIMIFSDISARKVNEERFVYLANHDALTGLANRHQLSERLAQAILMADRNGQGLALIFLDLDNFKQVNDVLGHACGDKLLINIANCLRKNLRTTDVIARLGGDEFVILLTNLSDNAVISQIVDKIIAGVAQPLVLSGNQVQVTTSVGVCVYPRDGDDAESLMMHADASMYAAKTAGKNQFRFFDPESNQESLARFELAQELRNAIDRGEFELFYQPQYKLGNPGCHAIIGVEALVRWHHPVRGMIAPDLFIPLAEETRLIIPLGDWILREASRQCLAWHRDGLAIKHVAINISAIQLESEQFVDSVKRALDETGVDPSTLEFELTESTALKNPEQTAITLCQLRELGIRLALDDFGTGHSSLTNLKRLPIDTLKIDREFVDGMATDNGNLEIIRMTVALAHAIQMRVVAEGVETQQQLDLLDTLSCDYIQGFYLSRPMPANQLGSLLTLNSPSAELNPA